MSHSIPRAETSAGAVVVHGRGADARYLLIHDAHGNWGFPKGHVENGESPLDAARREVSEETGMAGAINHGPLGVRQWTFGDGANRVEKTCHYYLFEADDLAAEPQTQEGISEVAWLPLEEAHSRLTFEVARDLLAEAAASLDLTRATD